MERVEGGNCPGPYDEVICTELRRVSKFNKTRVSTLTTMWPYMSLGANPSKTCIHSSIHPSNPSNPSNPSIHPSIHLLTYSIYSSKEHQPQKHDEGKTNNELHHENCCCYDLDENSTENFSTACPRKNIDQSTDKIKPESHWKSPLVWKKIP